jgi:hypothetical protein
MEYITVIIANWQEILNQGLLALGAFVSLLGAIYSIALIIPGDKPDVWIKALLDFTKKFSRK